MTKKEEFIEFINGIFNTMTDPLPENVELYWNTFCSKEEVEKPLFTDNGKLILKFLQNNQDTTIWKSKDIAEGLFVSSRTVAGAIRKLVADGYVEKMGDSPSIYTITEKGKNINLDNE